MKDIKRIHRQAMEQSDLALLAKMDGNEQAAADHAQSAYELESEAANSLMNELDAEPARSVLFRSAATLARDCGRFSDAEQLAYRGLAGNPPAEIADELRDLLEQVSFRRHLELRGVELSDEEIQMTITGKSVGFGMAPADVFLGRVRSTEMLLFRTAERKQNRPYRDRGRRDSQLAQGMELYLSVPRAACFAVTFRVGSSSQQSLPGFSHSEAVIDELLDCLQLYTRGEEQQLKARIQGDAYYRNFINLARTLQPDGTKINMVGFTTVRRGTTKHVAMTEAIETPVLSAEDIFPNENKANKSAEELVRLNGTLKLANSLKKEDEIQILTSGNMKVTIVVPPGMMSDIVKPLWESEVEVIGTLRGKKIHLMQIKPVS